MEAGYFYTAYARILVFYGLNFKHKVQHFSHFFH